MAPIVSLRTLKKWGLKNNELRKIRDGRIGGFMYLPQHNSLFIDDHNAPTDEWKGHAAALLYRPATVSQVLLDRTERVARLTSDATKILNAGLIQTFTPNRFNWRDLAPPDITSSW